MALKPTIYKFRVSLSDLNRDYYDTLSFTIAQHPSETLERMVARLMAFAINAKEYLVFTKGLSEADEPDIWVKEFDDSISLWIEVGEPNAERIKKSTRRAAIVKIYSFNSKSDEWWKQGRGKFSELAASIYQFPWQEIEKLATMVERTMDWSITITGDAAYIATALGECEVSWATLQSV